MKQTEKNLTLIKFFRKLPQENKAVTKCRGDWILLPGLQGWSKAGQGFTLPSCSLWWLQPIARRDTSSTLMSPSQVFLAPIFRFYLIQEYQNIIRIQEQGYNRSQLLFYLLALQTQLSSFKVMVCKNVENHHKLT